VLCGTTIGSINIYLICRYVKKKLLENKERGETLKNRVKDGDKKPSIVTHALTA
jgi:hypothetical protein